MPYGLTDLEFLRNFRLNKQAFRYVAGELEAKLPKRKRSSGLSAAAKLATALRILAEGGYQRGAGNDFNLGLAQPTVSKVFKQVISTLETVLCPKWITFQMTASEKTEAKNFFYTKTGFPGVLGCVDGTHIAVIPPKVNKHLFYNRKGFYSLNAMVICDHKMKIRFFDARHPGANHDSLIWRLSDAKAILERNFEDGQRNSWLLGDAGYALEPYLMTPFRAAAENSPEGRFNSVHAYTRNIVERTIGELKNRFRCLLQARVLHYEPQKATSIANVCAALHNICIEYGAPMPEIRQHTDHDAEEGDTNNEHDNQLATDIRNAIMRSLHRIN